MPDGRKTTIEDVFDEFLDDQEDRCAMATFHGYATSIDHLEAYLEQHWPGHESEQERIRALGGTFCGTYAASELAPHFPRFLRDYLPHQAPGDHGTEKAARSLIKKLAPWLVAKGYDPNAGQATG